MGSVVGASIAVFLLVWYSPYALHNGIGLTCAKVVATVVSILPATAEVPERPLEKAVPVKKFQLSYQYQVGDKTYRSEMFYPDDHHAGPTSLSAKWLAAYNPGDPIEVWVSQIRPSWSVVRPATPWSFARLAGPVLAALVLVFLSIRNMRRRHQDVHPRAGMADDAPVTILRVKFQRTAQDLSELARTYWAPGKLWTIRFYLAVTVWSLVSSLAATGSPGTEFLIWPAIIVAVIVITEYRIQRRAADRSDVGAEVECEIDAAGLTFREKLLTAHVPWSNVLRVERAESGYMIPTRDAQIQWLPVRAFNELADSVAFERLVCSRVPSKNLSLS